ncbi:MAG TPA: hypothetical protein VHB47_12765 [Thermoanaerobaculia bacterium]|nr:hypothetical protein [Thermoanaerobaculia bacterium]
MPLIGNRCRAHDQDNVEFCGEAAEMMICANQSPQLLPTLRQRDLAPAAPPTGDFTPPAEVSAVLNAKLSGRRFSVQQAASGGAAMAGIVSALKTNQVPVAVLLNAGGHWGVVAAVQTDVEPQPGKPYQVQSVYFNSPSLLQSPPDPHTEHDDCCGCRDPAFSSLLAGYNIPYQDWLNDWLTPKPSAGTLPFTYICATQPASIVAQLASRIRFLGNSLKEWWRMGKSGQPGDANPKAWLDEQFKPDLMEPTAPLVPPARTPPLSQGDQEDMVRESRTGLAAMLLSGSPPRTVLDLMGGANAGPSIRVQRLDDSSDHYFLVPWKLEGKVVMTTQIAGDSGRFAGVHFHGRDWFVELGGDDPEARKRRLDQLRIDLVSPALDRPAVGWRPCQESFSPHFPFAQLTGRRRSSHERLTPLVLDETGGGEPLFVRLDGNVFSKLTH